MKYLMVAEVADLLRVRRETVYRWIKDGEIASIHLGRTVRISEDALQSFIKAHERKENKWERLNQR